MANQLLFLSRMYCRRPLWLCRVSSHAAFLCFILFLAAPPAFAQDSVDFSDQPVEIGMSGDLIYNYVYDGGPLGILAADLESIRIEADNDSQSGEFRVVGGTCLNDAILYEGDSCAVQIGFSPENPPGLRTGSIVIEKRLYDTADIPAVNPAPEDLLAAPSAPNSIRIRFTADAIDTVSVNELSLAFANDQVAESEQEYTFEINRNGRSAGESRVDYEVTGSGLGELPDSSGSINGTIVWEDGDQSPQSVSIPLIVDDIVGPNKVFFIRLTNPQPESTSSLGLSQAEITIIDDSEPAELSTGAISLSSSDVVSVFEGEETFLELTRSGGSAGTMSVVVTTAQGSAQENEDFVFLSQTVTWADGESGEKTVAVQTLSDQFFTESTELFQIRITGVGNSHSADTSDDVFIGTDTVNVSILNDIGNPGLLAFSAQEYRVSEEDGTVIISVTRTGGSDGEVMVGYSTEDDEAIAGEDYESTSGELIWQNGDVSDKTFSVPITLDLNSNESTESFLLNLSGAMPYGDGIQLSEQVQSVVSILNTQSDDPDGAVDDDIQPGSIQFVSGQNNVAVVEGDAHTVSVQRVGGVDGEISVDIVLVSASATVGASGDVLITNSSNSSSANTLRSTLVWPDGDSSVQTVNLDIVSDQIEEGSEQFSIVLENPVPFGLITLGSPIQLTISDAQVSQSRLVLLTDTEFTAIPGQTIDSLTVGLESGAESFVEWRVFPAGAVIFLEGDLTDFGAVLPLSSNGQANMRVEVVSRGLIQLIATPGARSSSISFNNVQQRSNPSQRSDPSLVETFDGETRILIRSGFAIADGLNTNQRSTAGALDSACDPFLIGELSGEALTAGQIDLENTCRALEQLESEGDNAGLAAALDRLTPEEVFYFSDTLVDSSDIQVTNIYSRLNALRRGAFAEQQIDVSGLSLNLYGEVIPGVVFEAAKQALVGGGASSDDLPGIASRWGMFANGEISSGEIDGNGIQRDADLSTTGLTFGLDYRVSSNVVVGAGIGITANDTNFTGGEGEASTDGFNVSLYGTWYETDKGYADAVLDVGFYDFEMSRRIDLPGSANAQFADSHTDSAAISFTGGAARTFNLKGWEFGPYVNISLISGSVDGYSEKLAHPEHTGLGSLLNVRSHSASSTRFALGWQVSRAVSFSRGVFLPQFRLEMQLENEERKDPVEVVFQSDDAQTTFEVEGNDRDSEYLNIGLGGSLLLKNGRSGFIFYETRTQNEFVSQHSLKLGMRFEF